MNTPNNTPPQGYKMTELGALPEEWKVVRLSNLIEEVKEKNKDNEKLKVYTVSNIFGFILSDLFFDKKVYSKELTNYKIIRENYFAYNPYRINVGSIGLFQDYIGLVSPAYIVFKIKKIHELNPNYFFLLLKSSYYTSEIKRMAMSRGSIRRSLSFKDLSDFPIPLPPLAEQQKIAAVLSAVQEAKEKTEAVIVAAKVLKKSMMKHLFTYGPVSPQEAENVPLKETEIGPVPEDWEVVKLGEITETYSGGTPSRDQKKYFVGKIGWLKSGELDDNYIYSTQEFISEEALKKSSAKYVENNTLLIALYGATSGKVGLAKSKFTINQAICAVKPNNKFFTEFYFYYIQTIRDKLLSMRFGGAQPNLNQQIIKNIILPLPPLPIQQRIASILSAIDEKIEAEENKKKALEELFKSLLHNLMTAKIRVNKLEITL